MIYITIVFYRNFRCRRKQNVSLPTRTASHIGSKLVTSTKTLSQMHQLILTIVNMQNHTHCSVQWIWNNSGNGKMKTANLVLFDNSLESELKCILFDAKTRNSTRWKQRVLLRHIINVIYVTNIISEHSAIWRQERPSSGRSDPLFIIWRLCLSGSQVKSSQVAFNKKRDKRTFVQ